MKTILRSISFCLFVSIVSTWTASAAKQPPIITQEPTNQMLVAGSRANFSVAATGSGTLSYQWYFGGVAMVGQTHNTLTINNVQSLNGGSYSVTVANAYGSASSAAVTLVVYTNSISFDTNAGQFYFNYGGSDVSL